MIDPKTQEQAALQADLILRYGALTFDRAWNLSALRNCLTALSIQSLTADERATAYEAASHHLAQLRVTLMASDLIALTECGKRIDAAVDAWTLDELEARDGLPALEGIQQN